MTKKSGEFEEKVEKAKQTLEKLMDPEITLSEGMKEYKEGIKELQEAAQILEKAKLEFEELQDKQEE